MSDGKRYLLTGAVCCVIFGVISIVVGLRERRLAATANQVPEEISLKDLIARGPGGNPNIILKDFVLCDNFVYETRGMMWTSAWVPAVPRESVPPGQVQGGKPAAVLALIFTINARNAPDLFQRCGQPRLPALVTNQIVSLGSKEKSLLEQSYPGTDFSRCLIIQEGREPAGATKQLLMIGGGCLVALIGLGIGGFMGVQWYRDRPAPRRKRRVREERPRRRQPIQDEEDEPPPRRAAKSQRDDEEEEDRRRRPRRPQREDEE